MNTSQIFYISSRRNCRQRWTSTCGHKYVPKNARASIQELLNSKLLTAWLAKSALTRLAIGTFNTWKVKSFAPHHSLVTMLTDGRRTIGRFFGDLRTDSGADKSADGRGSSARATK